MLTSLVFVALIIGWFYYKLAKNHGKNALLYLAIGIGAFFLTFISLWTLLVTYAAGINSFVTESILVFLVLAVCFGLYKFLERKWDGQHFNNKRDSNLLDDHLGGNG